jgi:hypothetical protein
VTEPSSMDEREGALRQDGLVVGIVGFGLVNGTYTSPMFDQVFILLRPFAPTFFLTPILLFYLTSLFCATFTIILAGIPAAIYERSFGGRKSSGTSLMIWFAGVVLLSIPAIMRMLGV